MPPNHKVPSTRTPGDPPITPWDSTRPKIAKNDPKKASKYENLHSFFPEAFKTLLKDEKTQF